MKAPNVCLDKSVEFSIAIITCTERIAKEKNEYVLTKQLLRSGTSVGANVSESVYAQSKPDFIHKLSIALKEAKESFYWLKLLHTTGYMNQSEFENIKSLNNDLLNLLSKSIRTSKKNFTQANSPNPKSPRK